MWKLSRFISGLLVAGLAAAPLHSFAQARDGQHDFDFNFGSWHTHIKRLENPLAHSTRWLTYDGTVTVRKIWGGRANLEEIEADGPSHLELLGVRTYNPQSHQWELNGASSDDGTLGTPAYGDFDNGALTFYDRETYNNRMVTVRQVFSHITANSYHYEQAFSDDGGKTWEPNFIAQLTRTSTTAPSEGARSVANTSHDFDFNYATWSTRIKALDYAVDGTVTSTPLTGTVAVRKIWNGKAIMEEINAGSGKTSFTGLTLFLYDPQSHQWSQTYADSSDGAFEPSMIGSGVHHGYGEEIGPGTYGGQAVLMHDEWSHFTPNGHHFEVGYSRDGGKTWRPLFVADLTRKGPGL